MMERSRKDCLDFIVPGAQKSGTTALYEYLRRHPRIAMPTGKEAPFFNRENYAVNDFETFLLQHYPQARLDKIWGSVRAGRTLAGDFSPSYLHFEEAAQRIFAINKEARIIAILRDPTERTISHYLMDVAKGFQREPLAAFFERTAANDPFYREYIGASFYATAIERYLHLFGPARVLTLISEELWADPASGVQRVLTFLGAEHTINVQTEDAANAYFEPRFAFVRQLRRVPLAQTAFRMLPEHLRTALKDLMQRRGGKRPDFTAERMFLDRLFAPEVGRLSALLGLDLGGVWQRHSSTGNLKGLGTDES